MYWVRQTFCVICCCVTYSERSWQCCRHQFCSQFLRNLQYVGMCWKTKLWAFYMYVDVRMLYVHMLYDVMCLASSFHDELLYPSVKSIVVWSILRSSKGFRSRFGCHSDIINTNSRIPILLQYDFFVLPSRNFFVLPSWKHFITFLVCMFCLCLGCVLVTVYSKKCQHVPINDLIHILNAYMSLPGPHTKYILLLVLVISRGSCKQECGRSRRRCATYAHVRM
jgi:hypothetical protein